MNYGTVVLITYVISYCGEYVSSRIVANMCHLVLRRICKISYRGAASVISNCG